MTILALDDTDSRSQGMCTTYIGHQIASDLRSADYTVDRLLLVRVNYPHPTRSLRSRFAP